MLRRNRRFTEVPGRSRALPGLVVNNNAVIRRLAVVYGRFPFNLEHDLVSLSAGIFSIFKRCCQIARRIIAKENRGFGAVCEAGDYLKYPVQFPRCKRCVTGCYVYPARPQRKLLLTAVRKCYFA